MLTVRNSFWRDSSFRYKSRGNLLIVISIAAIFSYSIPAFADARSDYLIRLLKESSQFRVRAQAAISLGSVKAEPAVLDALQKALEDANPAVRAASASSLERIGDQSVLPALKSALNDDEQAVRTAAQRAISAVSRRASNLVTERAITETAPSKGSNKFYVGIGVPGTRVKSVGRDTLKQTRQFIEEQVRTIEGVLIAPEKETPAKVRSVLKKQKLNGFYLDSSLVSLEPTPEGGVRAVVSIIVGTYPDRNMRTILQGSARVTGSAGSIKTLAIEAAVRGALRQFPTVLSMGSQ
jgi:hypothetical protein